MNNEEQNAMNTLAAALVEKIDGMGKGVECMERLGQEKFKALMEMARAGEASQGE